LRLTKSSPVGSKDSFLRVNDGVGDGIACKRVLITVKTEIDDTASQIGLRGMVDKSWLYLVTHEAFKDSSEDPFL
jgi:hypothetical protein